MISTAAQGVLGTEKIDGEVPAGDTGAGAEIDAKLETKRIDGEVPAAEPDAKLKSNKMQLDG